MGDIKKRDVYLMLFEEYEIAKGYSEKTAKKDRDVLRIIQKHTGKGEYITLSDVEQVIEERRAGKWYRANLRRAFRKYKAFLEWWEGEGINDFREWLQRQGYSKWTVRDYVDMLRMASGRRKATKEEKRRLNKALRAYKAFLRERFGRD